MATTGHDFYYPAPIPDGVVLGERGWFHSTIAFIHNRSARRPSLLVGNDTGIYAETYFDLGPEGEVSIGDYCSIAAAVISTNGRVTIGDYAFIGHETVLADRGDVVPPPSRGRLGPSPREGAEISIGENVWIGVRAIILGGTNIGPDAVVGAGAVVDGMRVPAGAIVAGNPARIVGRVGGAED